MKFNATKCYILSVNKDQKKKSLYHYQLNKTILKHVNNNPYLGILFSQDLTWNDHISKITNKANSTLGFLQRNLRHCPRRCKQTAYLSLVRSVLEYGAVLWDPYLQKDIDMLERVQRKALRFICNDYKNYKPGTIRNHQEKCKLPSLQDRRKALRLTFMYKVVEGLVPALPTEKFIQLNKSGRHIRPKRNQNFIVNNPVDKFIRNNDKSIKIKDSNCVQYKNSFFIRTASDWNHLSNPTVQATSLDNYKNLVSKELKLD